MTTQPTLSELTDKMKDHPSTAGWDAVCSYDATKLNSILADQFKNLHQITTIDMGNAEIPYRSDYNSFNVPNVTKGVTLTQVSYAFKLDLPTLQFASSDSKAELDMPITSSSQSGLAYTLVFPKNVDLSAGASLKDNTWYIQDQTSKNFYEKPQKDMLADCWDANTGKAKSPFPTNYFYKAKDSSLTAEFNDKLYNLSYIDAAFPATGDGGNGSDPLAGKTYSLQALVPLGSVAGNQVYPSGHVVTFDASQGRTKGQVILNFDITRGTGASFSLLESNGSNDMPEILKDAPHLLEDFKVYFSQALNDIQLKLAGVKVGDVTDNQIPVKPRAFMFWADKIGDFSVLSIYINIDGSDTPNPKGQPSFQYNDGTVGSPVPQEYSGSLILSRDFLTRYYFLKAFTRAGFNSMNPTGNTLSPISFGGGLHKPTIVQGKDIDVSISFSSVFSGFTGADFGTVHVDDYNFSFEFRSDNIFEIKQAEVTKVDIPVYVHYQPPYSGEGLPPPPMTDTKQATVTLHIDKSISMTDAQPSQDGFKLEFSVTKDDYTVTSTSNISGICDDHTQRDVEKKVREEIGNTAPNISVSLPELQTLAIENMLFNGAEKFHLTPAAKMHFPHDLLLLGDLK